MTKPGILLRLAAILSSVLLIGAFVSYRAGAFSLPLGNQSQPMESQESQGQPTYLIDGTSKSARMFAEQPASGKPVFMSGSKSDTGLIPVPPTGGQTVSPPFPAPPPPRRAQVMSGSKSRVPIVDPAPAQRARTPSQK